MREQDKRSKSRGLFRNLLWLFTLLALAAATFVVFEVGGELFVPSRETAVVRVFRDASAAVVNISAQPLVERRELGLRSRRWQLWENFFGRPSGSVGEERKFNYGSGIIVDPRGYILTNEHVVINTAWIQVKLADGRTVLGEVWGTEPGLDLAVVKVEVDEPLPYLEMGISEDIMVGEQIVVIGNPLGRLGHTCTTGIVSSLHRSIKAGNRIYKDLIQIDAAVNPGNSGGPLLNIRGDLIGITAALNPDTEGIGFAIPIEHARQVVDDLIQYRYVPTGWLGVSVEGLQETAEAFGLLGGDGVFISQIEANGPAAGVLKAGDIIESWNGEALSGLEDFVKRARELRTGQSVKLSGLREGKAQEVTVEVGAFPEHVAQDWAWWHLGVMVDEKKFRVRSRDGSIVVRQGVFIQRVASNSPASAYGLIPGDLVLRLNRENIGSLDDFLRAIVRLRFRKNIFIVFGRGNFQLYVTVPFRMSGERW